MKTPLYLLAALLACAATVLLGIWWDARQTSARRLAAWKEQQQTERTAEVVLDRLVTLQGGKLLLAEFEALLERLSGLAVEIDQPVLAADARRRIAGMIRVRLPTGALTLRSALRIALEPHDLAADLRGRTLWITTLDEAVERNRLLTVVYPLPQPEPAGIGDDDWRWKLDSYVKQNGQGRTEAVPGALIVVTSGEGHGKIRRIFDAISNLGEPGEHPVAIPPPPPGDMEQRIAAALDQPTEMNFVETPLDEAIAALMERHDIPILLSVRKLQDAGVTVNSPVTKRLTGISLRSGLRLLLKEMDLVCVVRDEVLWITTPDEPGSQLHDVAYPVTDLVESARGRDFESLIEIIERTIAPHSWDDVGGPGSIGRLHGGWLLIRQTDEIQRQVRELLEQLRLALRTDQPAERRMPLKSDAEAKIHLALARQLPLEFDETPLKDVAWFLQHTLSVPVVLNAKTLNDAGINIDAPVRAKLPSGQASWQLRFLLEQLDLTYIVRDEVVQITTLDDAESQLDMRLFNVRALLGTRVSPARLCDLIANVARPSTWDDVGGPGSIEHFRGLLVITQTQEILEEIESLLSALKRHCVPVRPSSPATAAIRINVSPEQERLEAVLERPAQVKLPALPLLVALGVISSEHGLQIVPDLKFLLDIGLQLHDETRPAIEAASLREALDQLLAPPDAQQTGLAWIVREHAVFATTTDRIDQLKELRLYWVGDLASKSAGQVRQAILDAPAVGWLAANRPSRSFLASESAIEVIDPDWLVIRAEQPLHRKVEAWLRAQRTER